MKEQDIIKFDEGVAFSHVISERLGELAYYRERLKQWKSKVYLDNSKTLGIPYIISFISIISPSMIRVLLRSLCESTC